MASENLENKKSPAALREEAILQFWKDQKIFEKSLNRKENPNGEFVFFEGPPTANAKPALHHLEARAFKDVIPRYKTMQGFHVRRRAGWDTHGLPVELQIEKKLALNSKKEIENYGIAKFNKECKDSVFEYIADWEKFTGRIGFWVNNEDAYFTFDAKYIESLWNIVAKVNEQNLLYKDYRVVPFCPRCGTALSSHELAQGYQEDKDLSVYVKFKIVGVENGYFLAWTTTPWTLPGNVALVVGNDIAYVEIKVGDEILVLAKDCLSLITESYKILVEHKGAEMIGMEYESLYPYLSDLDNGDEKLKNAFKIYVADFVNTDEGTGIVHIAPMYGQDDFILATKNKLPKFHIVDETGHFIQGIGDLARKFVKEKDENGKPLVDVEIIDYLKKKNLFFKQESIKHQYPHCWRCKTPLIYYARDSWYIAMSQLRDTLIAENEKINWEPEHIKEGRFGEWLREVKDWAISRERYWGTPLPIWVADDGERMVIDSFEMMKKYTKKSGNKYFVMRHGETENNLTDLIGCNIKSDNDHLTENGKEFVKKSAQSLLDKKIEAIYCSDFIRARETAEIVCEVLGLDKNKIIFDSRLWEFNVDGFDGNTWSEYFQKYPFANRFVEKPQGGETLIELKNRSMSFLSETDSKYNGKNILIIGHGSPLALLFVGSQGLNREQIIATRKADENFYLKNAEIRELDFIPLPHNENYELDPHRPFIDEIIFEKDGKQFKRVKEVIDVWFDSGSMPFAQDHYPFENKKWIEEMGYPAQFISEAIDQTRGWFYVLLAVGVLMDRGTPYQNVISLGHLLDAQGKKMSKSIGNIVEPWNEIEKYGADALRLWMYSINQPGDSKNYDEKTVLELSRQVFGLLYNVLAFYELYRDMELEKNNSESISENVLDVWIFARLNQLTELMTTSLDAYKLMEPVRAMRDFINDLSTWYLRRSRDRIKDSDNNAKRTLYFVLKNLAKLLAPFAPFTAEDLWMKLKNESDLESVHLENWSELKDFDFLVIKNMELTRSICTEGNALRKKNNIPIRQPLLSLKVKSPITDILDEKYLELIKDELNVKEVIEDKTIANDFELDTNITPELKREGEYRELVRTVQDLRKEKGLTPNDVMDLVLSNDYQKIVSGFEDDLKKTVSAKTIEFVDGEEKIKI